MSGKLIKSKLAVKLTTWFLLFAMVPLSVAAFLSYSGAKKQLELEIISKLVNTANNKAKLIENYAVEKKSDADILAYDSTTIEALKKLTEAFEKNGLNSSEYNSVSNKAMPFFAHYEKAEGCKDIYLISAKGEVVFTLNKGKELGYSCATGQGEDCVLRKAFQLTNRLLSAQISGFEYDKDTGRSSIFVAAPVIKNGKSIGAVALEMNNKEIENLARDYRGLGKTGEITIGTKSGDNGFFVTPTRHDPNAAFKRILDISPKSHLPLAHALRGESGYEIDKDYRGKEVLAAYTYLPSFNCGLAVKMDKAEAFAPVYKLRNSIIVIMIFVFVWSVLAAFYVSKSISDPIKHLHKGTEIIGGGNLDYKVAVEANDEIGQLAGAFNDMAINLKNITSSRDELDKEISERIKAEENLKKETAFIENALNTLPDIFYSFDLEGKFLKWNREFSKVSGYSDEEIAVMKPADFFRGKDVERVTEAIGTAIKDGKAEVEALLVTKAGDSISYELSGGRLENYNGKLVGITGAGRNIAERKKYEDELKKRLHELEIFHKAATGREERIIELKEKIRELEGKLNNQA